MSADSVIQSHKDYVSGAPRFVGTRVPVKNLFDYLVMGYDLKDFHYSFPSVHPETAVAALKMAKEFMKVAAHKSPSGIYRCDRQIMGDNNTPVYVGTPEQVNRMFDVLMQARPLKDFLYEEPSLAPWQCEAALRNAQDILEKEAYEAAAR